MLPKVVSIIIILSFDLLNEEKQETEKEKREKIIKKANINLFIIFKVSIKSAKLRYIINN